MPACFCAFVFATKGAAIIRIRATTVTKDTLCFFIAHSPCIASRRSRLTFSEGQEHITRTAIRVDGQRSRRKRIHRLRRFTNCKRTGGRRLTVDCLLPCLLWLVLRPSATLPSRA